MLGLIRLEIIELVPEALALTAICLLVLIACLLTRSLTIRHMRKYLPGMQQDELKDRGRQIESLKNENRLLRAENNEQYVQLKTVKAVTDKVIL